MSAAVQAVSTSFTPRTYGAVPVLICASVEKKFRPSSSFFERAFKGVVFSECPSDLCVTTQGANVLFSTNAPSVLTKLSKAFSRAGIEFSTNPDGALQCSMAVLVQHKLAPDVSPS